MSAYYEQYDAEDLDSWQGKEINGEDLNNDDEHFTEAKKILEAECYVRDDMDDLCWRDFF